MLIRLFVVGWLLVQGILIETALGETAQSMKDPLKWRVDEMGTLWVSPNPAQFTANGKLDWNSKTPLLQMTHESEIFGPFTKMPLGRRITLWDQVKGSGAPGMMNYLLHGGLDLASLTDAETHFRKLKLGISDEELLKRIQAPPVKGLTPPMTAREHLDRILAVRLCGVRKLKAAEDQLRHLVGHPRTERFLKDAATMAVTMIDGTARPLHNDGGTSVEKTLPHLPDHCDYLVVVRPSHAPVIHRPFWIARRIGIQMMESVFKGMPATSKFPLVGQRVAGFFAVDQAGEMNYELARRVGNMRLDQVVHAGQLDPRTGMPHETATLFQGIFPVRRWKKFLKKPFLKVDGERLIYQPTGNGSLFELHPRLA